MLSATPIEGPACRTNPTNYKRLPSGAVRSGFRKPRLDPQRNAQHPFNIALPENEVYTPRLSSVARLLAAQATEDLPAGRDRPGPLHPEASAMPSPAVIDVESLAAAVNDESPVGVDLRADASAASVFYDIKDARSTARAAERQALMGDPEAPEADWRPILELAPKILAESSKDLEVTAYYIEALVRETGLAGLRDGFQLAAALVRSFGDDIFPLPDEDGIETRVAPFTGLNGFDAEGTLVSPIRRVPITDSHDLGPFGLGDYLQAKELERLEPDAKAARVSQGVPSIEDFQAAARETSGEYFRDLLEDLVECQDAFADLDAAMTEKYGHDAPPTSQIRETLQECREVIENVGRDKLSMLVDTSAEEEAAEDDAEAGEGAPAGAASAPKATVGEIHNREDAFREIIKIAGFFRRTEPHTPISYALEQVVRWGKMPLPDLLKELITDEQSVSQMFRMVGMRPDGSPDDSDYS